MNSSGITTVVSAGRKLLDKSELSEAVEILTKTAIEQTCSDLAAFYIFLNTENRRSLLKLYKKKFLRVLPESFSPGSEFVSFILDCREPAVLLSTDGDAGNSYLKEIILHSSMRSGAVFPVITEEKMMGVLFVNSKEDNHYNGSRMDLLENITQFSSDIFEKQTYKKD